MLTIIAISNFFRAEPIHSFAWGADTVNTIKFNQTEVSIFASTGNDRSITLYDLRTNSPLFKVYLHVRRMLFNSIPSFTLHFFSIFKPCLLI